MREDFFVIFVLVGVIGICHQFRGVAPTLDFTPSPEIFCHLGEVPWVGSCACQPLIGEGYLVWSGGIEVSEALEVTKTASPETHISR